MVSLHWLIVLWSFLVYTGMLNIFSIRFKLMIVSFTLLHLGLVHVCALCNVFTCDVPSVALFATLRSCGFAALSHALRSRGVNVVFHLSHLFGLWCFSLWCLETVFLFCFVALRHIGMRLCGPAFLCQSYRHDVPLDSAFPALRSVVTQTRSVVVTLSLSLSR